MSKVEARSTTRLFVLCATCCLLGMLNPVGPHQVVCASLYAQDMICLLGRRIMIAVRSRPMEAVKAVCRNKTSLSEGQVVDEARRS